MFYKYGGKQLYYNNTYDGQGEIDIERINQNPDSDTMSLNHMDIDDTDCDSCKI